MNLFLFFVFNFFYFHLHSGKPVAVTHSKGKGAPLKGPQVLHEETYYKMKYRSNEDISDEDGEMEIVEGRSDITSHDVCNSRAEIASCSYEARQVCLQATWNFDNWFIFFNIFSFLNMYQFLNLLSFMTYYLFS